MNILIISYLFPPIVNPQGILGARLAKYLNKAGHVVTVIAGTEIESFGSTHGVDTELIDDLNGIEIIYVRDTIHSGLINEFKSKIIYHENYNYWVEKVLEVAIPICKNKKIDIIYSMSAPLASNIVGMKLKKLENIPWIAHFSDPTILALGLKFKSPLRTYFTYADERALLEYSDGITFVNEDTLLKTTQHNKQYRNKCIVLPHFYDPDYYNIAQQNKLTLNSKIIFTYVGSLYGRRNPFDVINAFNLLGQEHPELCERFELHLYGAIDSEIMKTIDQKSISWLTVHGSVSYRNSIRAMQCCNHLLLIDMPNVDNMFTPSKLIDYLAADVPIIGITPKESNSARILRSISYPVFEPGDIIGLSNLFREILVNPEQALPKNHKIVAKTFRVDNVVNMLVEFMNNTIVECSHGTK